MIDSIGSLALGLALLIPCLALTAGALWTSARIVPWFMKQRVETPTVRSFFLAASDDMEPARMTTIILAAAMLLAVLTPMIALVRFGLIGG